MILTKKEAKEICRAYDFLESYIDSNNFDTISAFISNLPEGFEVIAKDEEEMKGCTIEYAGCEFDVTDSPYYGCLVIEDEICLDDFRSGPNQRIRINELR